MVVCIFQRSVFHGERVGGGLSFRVKEVCGVQRVGVVRYVSSYGHVQRKDCESTVEVEDGHPICVHFGSVASPLVIYYSLLPAASVRCQHYCLPTNTPSVPP